MDSISSPFPLPATIETSSPTTPVSPSQQQQPPQPHLYVTLEGVQSVSKFNLPASQADYVKIFLGVIRVDLHEQRHSDPSQKRGADITVTVNVPVGKVHSVDTEGALESAATEHEVKAKDLFQKAIGDFRILDYGLFA